MEDFVTFELAKKLKEKGFPQRTFGNYDMQGACYVEDGRFYENGCITEVSRAYTAPTISQVLKWLRETSIHINIEICVTGWYCSIYKFSKDENGLYDINDTYLISGKICDNYEDAVLAGIEYVLNNNLI